ncbi:MAG: BlaI/MecI/CopY family transcriptional regulator [Candidatus Kerfeldbacteria bacterium]|nr:BlaI/MecI/CopY family transcriptional regulator [Candidatus Kerfeldbacteria bacterium]
MASVTKPLGELEQTVMDIVWRYERVNVRCVCTELNKRRAIAYTTVMTTMERLTKKGILQRRKIQKAYLYQATRNEQQFNATVSRTMLGNLLRQYGDLAIAQFVDALDEIDGSKLKELKRQIDERAK